MFDVRCFPISWCHRSSSPRPSPPSDGGEGASAQAHAAFSTLGCWMLDVGCSMFDVGCSMFDVFQITLLLSPALSSIRWRRGSVRVPSVRCFRTFFGFFELAPSV